MLANDKEEKKVAFVKLTIGDRARQRFKRLETTDSYVAIKRDPHVQSILLDKRKN
ncbi:hypothetical protein A3Q56_05178 [Intoshia linei]|uniref:Uncharacterized protein n=1 Tax=Intoshia linei TaxID=1819745 RepID=A0A177AYZ6_9BILA|nr:hypothetical protein A3Q56_05178 [Intoshia linei]